MGETEKQLAKQGLAPLAARLREARQNAGYKRFEDAARKAGISVNTLKSYEYAKFVPNAFNVAALAKAYAVTCDWLLGLTEQEGPLPRGSALVNGKLAMDILCAVSKEELMTLLDRDPVLATFILEVTEHTQLMSHEEAMLLGEKVSARVRELAPELLERWQKGEEGD